MTSAQVEKRPIPSMMHETAWQDIREQLPGLEHADIVVGLPTFNNAATVQPVIRAVTQGLRHAFPQATVLLMNADAGSQDGTPDVIKASVDEQFPVALLQHPSGGVLASIDALPHLSTPGRDEAFRSFFAAAHAAGAAACAIIDPAVRSMTPEWMTWLLSPILEGRAEYVAPLFHRPRYEGSLTNSLVYPLNRALYGPIVRYHTGGGYGLSGALASLYRDRDLWEGNSPGYGIDSWLTTVAVAEGRKVCQAGLGEKIVEPPPGGEDLSAVLAQAVGSVFYFMERYQDLWESRQGSQPVQHVGLPYRPGPDRAPVNVDRMIRGFRQGLRDLLPIWQIILSPETLSGILPLGLIEKDEFRFPAPLWVQTVYDFALAYHEKVLHRDHLLKSLAPLYLGQMASLVLETRDGKPQAVEDSIEALCQTFTRMKPYVIERWRFS
jgi:glucosylglycerate synthase